MRQLICIALLLLSGLSGHAQHKVDVETTIKDLEQVGVKGILTADTTLLNQIWAPDYGQHAPQHDC